MLPVQTVMIRYMVLVYRWGSGWLSAVGAWEAFAGGCSGRVEALAGGGGTRGGALTAGAKRPRRRGAGGASAHIIQNLPLVLSSHSS